MSVRHERMTRKKRQFGRMVIALHSKLIMFRAMDFRWQDELTDRVFLPEATTTVGKQYLIMDQNTNSRMCALNVITCTPALSIVWSSHLPCSIRHGLLAVSANQSKELVFPWFLTSSTHYRFHILGLKNWFYWFLPVIDLHAK